MDQTEAPPASSSGLAMIGPVKATPLRQPRTTGRPAETTTGDPATPKTDTPSAEPKNPKTPADPPATAQKPPGEESLADAERKAPPPEVVVPRQAGKRTITRQAAAFPVAPDLFVTSADTVASAMELVVTDLEGNDYKATLVRADEKLGLALLKTTGSKLPPIKLAAKFSTGRVDCLTFAASIFELRTENISGAIKEANGASSLTLTKEPRRPSGPLIVNNECVGVCLADRSANLGDLPLATLEQLQSFLGADLPATQAGFAMPTQVLCELTATVEVN
jgi:hypothetical protein